MADLREQLTALPERVTADELAVVFGVHTQTMWRWLRKGTLPGYRMGRTWKIYRDDVIKEMAARRGPGAPQPDAPAQTPAPSPLASHA